jgi:hypothetical protein
VVPLLDWLVLVGEDDDDVGEEEDDVGVDDVGEDVAGETLVIVVIGWCLVIGGRTPIIDGEKGNVVCVNGTDCRRTRSWSCWWSFMGAAMEKGCRVSARRLIANGVVIGCILFRFSCLSRSLWIRWCLLE